MANINASNRPGCLGSILALFGLKPKEEETENQEGPLPYRLRDDFLSQAERNFFQVLQSMAGSQLVVCTKVSLADLFFVVQSNVNKGALGRINRKHVDFLLCEPGTMRPLFAIELDDQSHNRADRVERDVFVEQVFKAAGLPLLRIPVQSSYSTVELGRLFNEAYRQRNSVPAPQELAVGTQVGNTGQIPMCPKCGVPMVLRVARSGENAGKSFYGCVNYPKCRIVVPAE